MPKPRVGIAAADAAGQDTTPRCASRGRRRGGPKPAPEVGFTRLPDGRRQRIIRDPTARLTGDAALRACEGRLHGLLDAILDPFVICSAVRATDGTIAEFRVDLANQALGTMVDRDPDTMVGQPLPDSLLSIGGLSLADHARDVVETGEQWEDEAVAFRPPSSGTGRRDLLNVRLVKLDDGFVATWHDVTDHERAPANHEQLLTAADQMAHGVLIADANGHVTYANQRFLAASGVTLADLIGRPAIGVASTGVLAGIRPQGEAERYAAVSAILIARDYRPVFQPIVDLESSVVVGYEALTRFASGQRPDLCFADAWSVNLGLELELATLEAAVVAAKDLPVGRWLDLNVSPRIVLDSERLRSILWAANRPIVLEVTEHHAIDDYDLVRRAVRDQGHNIRLAVDDAGAGVANFSHIIELRPDFVKLDISLVRKVDSDVGHQAIVVGLGHFSRMAGCRLIAEGVETVEEAAMLAALGIEFGQGYLFGHGEPVEAWAAMDLTRYQGKTSHRPSAWSWPRRS
jgi:EAL domain-containing protein (putative c-di-GMP-specific phosphodiesterase class I)/PAS domain-containing protein